MTEKFTVEKCMTQYVTLCMTQNMGATLLKIGVYDTKMYDTKCKTVYCIRLLHVEPSFTFIFPFIFMEPTKATL